MTTENTPVPTLYYVRVRKGVVVETYRPSFTFADVSLSCIAEMVEDARRWGDRIEVRADAPALNSKA